MFRSSFFQGSLALAVAGLLSGCGAGGGLFGSSEVTTNEPSTLDGYVTSDGIVVANGASAMAVGDNGADNGRRGFVRFTLAGIPSGATIVEAVLHLAQADVTGAPYATLGSVRVDHMDLGAGLDAGDYAAAPLVSDVGTLSGNAALETKSLDVSSSVAADVAAGRSTSDYRLRFLVTTDFDGIIDTAHFEDMENNQASGQVPVLTVVWK